MLKRVALTVIALLMILCGWLLSIVLEHRSDGSGGVRANALPGAASLHEGAQRGPLVERAQGLSHHIGPADQGPPESGEDGSEGEDGERDLEQELFARADGAARANRDLAARAQVPGEVAQVSPTPEAARAELSKIADRLAEEQGEGARSSMKRAGLLLSGLPPMEGVLLAARLNAALMRMSE